MRPVVLTIAGSDSGGGAGIQADLKTFLAHGAFGTSVITAVTAQNTAAVTAVLPLPLDLIEAQFRAVWEDFPVAAVKTGMLADAERVRLVARLLREAGARNVVIDPVMVAKSGAPLLTADAVAAVRDELLPLAAVVTPNAPEAEALTGIPVRDASSAEAAGRRLIELGAEAAVVKGGHFGADALDVLVTRDGTERLEAPRLETRNTHGTGCTFAAALAARLAWGEPLPLAARAAKRYVRRAMAAGLPLGAGARPLDHGFFLPSAAPEWPETAEGVTP
ncbi:Hydroxymethylpyrimidine/phosphomethylpyrimidine kinase [bacterium HR29]|jgi:hydroxymethylpyrimidine/phosphomethylpyrimidine kinase|nr:Hydroxymethylpyrimidine/phosphomethylpyrimidine kinase [bacterium HR29]